MRGLLPEGKQIPPFDPVARREWWDGFFAWVFEEGLDEVTSLLRLDYYVWAVYKFWPPWPVPSRASVIDLAPRLRRILLNNKWEHPTCVAE